MRWPDDEIGRSSVSPWTIPRTNAWRVREGVRILAHAGEREDEGKPERRRRGAIDDRAAHARDPTQTPRTRAPEKNVAKCGNPVNGGLDLPGPVP